MNVEYYLESRAVIARFLIDRGLVLSELQSIQEAELLIKLLLALDDKREADDGK